jgi:hypothetical protein
VPDGQHTGGGTLLKSKRKPKAPDSKVPQKSEHIQWHAAFIEALRMELEAYHDILDFRVEEELAVAPLRIDVVIIKKTRNVKIKKNFAQIFKGYNIIEYKSPGDYVSVEDFTKVYGYACFYSYLKKVPITDITLTFVESRHPRELLAHLKGVRGYRVEEKAAGIYTVSGDILPIQVIDSRKLSEDENLWLKNLTDRLNVKSGKRMVREIERRGKAARIGAYLFAISHANRAIIQEVRNMLSEKEFKKALEDAGFSAEWEARGEARTKLAVAQKLVGLGLPFDTVVSATQLEPEKVKSLYSQGQK